MRSKKQGRSRQPGRTPLPAEVPISNYFGPLQDLTATGEEMPGHSKMAPEPTAKGAPVLSPPHTRRSSVAASQPKKQLPALLDLPSRIPAAGSTSRRDGQRAESAARAPDDPHVTGSSVSAGHAPLRAPGVVAASPLLNPQLPVLTPVADWIELADALQDSGSMEVTKGHTEQTSVSLQQVLVVVGGKVLEEEEDEDEDDDEPPRTYPNFAYYNPKTKMWMSLPDFPDYNKWGFSITSLNNDVYITGGSRGSRDDSWSTRQGWRFVLNEGIWKLLSPMINPRTNHASASLNGEIYVIGGTLQDAVEVECYDPYSGIWSSVSPAQKYVSNFTAVGCGGKLYMVGSCAIKYNALTLQCYNPSTDSWCVIASPFIPKYLSSPRCCALGGAVYLIADNTKKVYMYLPEVNLWKKVQLLHTLHENGGMTSVGSRIYVTGGHWHGMAREYSVVMESYDSNSDTWSREGALPSRWMYHGTSAIFMDTSRWTTVFQGRTQMGV